MPGLETLIPQLMPNLKSLFSLELPFISEKPYRNFAQTARQASI